MRLSDTQKHFLFKALASKTQYQTGIEFGFDKYYKNNPTIINQVNRIYKEVKENPEKYHITPDVLDMVDKAMVERKTKATASMIPLTKPSDVDEKTLVVGAKSKAWDLLNKKLDYLYKSPKAFRSESIMNLAKIAGIVFDKAQIVRGEATENIAIRAKVDPNISSEEALAQLLKIREASFREED